MRQQLDSDQVRAYLSRIGIDTVPTAADLETLTMLMRQHLLCVPFENLDILMGRPIELSVAALFPKIMAGRGGFCYELNGMFAALLSAIGYGVRMISARVYSSSTGKYGPEFDHLALLVTVEGKQHLVDVGFGDTFRHPLDLSSSPQTDEAGSFRITGNEGGMQLQQKRDGQWEPDYRFTFREYQWADFEPICHYYQTDPASHFLHDPVCTIATPGGRRTLRRGIYTVTAGAHKRRLPVSTLATWKAILSGAFHIDGVIVGDWCLRNS